MSKLAIDEDVVKNVLRNRENLICVIHGKMIQLQKDLCNKNDIIRSVSMQRTQITDVSKSLGAFKDITDVYEMYEHKLEEQAFEFSQLLWKLVEEEEMIERIWLCYMALNEPYYSILENMYVKNEKYITSQESSGLSNQPFNQKRKEGIRTIIRLYNSDITDLQIQGMITNKKLAPHIKRKDFSEFE